MSSRNTVAVAAIAILTICVTLTGCSSTAKNTAAAGPNTPVAGAGPSSGPSAATASSSVSAAPPAGSGKRVDVCAVLPLSAVVAATGRSYSTATEKTVAAGALSADYCTYNGPDPTSLSLSMTVYYGDPDAAYQNAQASSNAAGETMSNVPGLGDKAFTDQDDLAVAYGSNVIAIADLVTPPGANPLSLTAKEQLVGAVHSAL